MSAERPINHEGAEGSEWDFHILQARVDRIYKEHDEVCGYGPDTMFAKLIGNAVTLSKASGKAYLDIETIDRALSNVFIWTATIANKAQLQLFNLVAEKFMLGCPRCHNIPCNLAHDKPCEEGKGEFNGQMELLNTIDGWQDHFANLYPNNFKGDLRLALRKNSSRVFEEAGELLSSTHQDINRDQTLLSHHDLPRDKNFPWRGEFADVLAWSFAVAETLNRITGSYSLGKSLEDKYSNGCPYCGGERCYCPRDTTVIEELSKWEAP
jgi:NTP pyrophosphatase (non-canonical NTP hydrolase)